MTAAERERIRRVARAAGVTVAELVRRYVEQLERLQARSVEGGGP